MFHSSVVKSAGKNLHLNNLGGSLSMKPQFHQIAYTSANPYNKRWEFKFKHSYYTYPRDYEHTEVKKP